MLSVSVRHPIYLYELSDESVFTDVMTVRFYVRFAVSPTTVIHFALVYVWSGARSVSIAMI